MLVVRFPGGGGGRGVLNGKKKSVPVPVFPKTPAGTPCAQPWLVAVGGWRLAAVGGWQLATGGWWRLVVVGGGWWLAVGGWRWLAVVGSWRLVAAGGWWRLVAGGWWRLVVGSWWRLAVDGSWRLAVGGPLGRSLRAVLSKKKKISSLTDPGGEASLGNRPPGGGRGPSSMGWGRTRGGGGVGGYGIYSEGSDATSAHVSYKYPPDQQPTDLFAAIPTLKIFPPAKIGDRPSNGHHFAEKAQWNATAPLPGADLAN